MGLAPLLNYTQVRKDDLISLGLTLLDVHGVTLPWMELPELDDIWAAMASVLGSWRTTDMEVSGLKAFNFNTHSPESVYLIQKQSIFRIYAGNQSHQKRSLDTSNIWIRSTHKIHQIMNIWSIYWAEHLQNKTSKKWTLASRIGRKSQLDIKSMFIIYTVYNHIYWFNSMISAKLVEYFEKLNEKI